MSTTDWAVLFCTLLLIVVYGVYKSRGIRNIDGYLLGNKSLPWYHVALSVMATQASAITFLSAPGLAYSSGMSFVQFYFGLPLAMIVLSISFVPIFHRLRVFTAYEFLEKRFDVRTRAFTALLFLIQRGLSTGITIYAPAIILSSILQINVVYTTLFIGTLVVLYTVYGGTKAVSYTQMLQMTIIFGGLLTAGVLVVYMLPGDIGLGKALHIAGKSGKANAIDLTFDWNNQYTLWSGLIGGFFLQLSYFGTDQSQVGRYLTGSSIRDSRIGLLMNGLLKVPMQFAILLIGILVFAYYQYNSPPIFFNKYELNKIENSGYAAQVDELKAEHELIFREKQQQIHRLTEALDQGDEAVIADVREQLRHADAQAKEVRQDLIALMQENDSLADTNDNNYIFLSFVTENFPKGLIGLLVAIVFMASMGATASAINSLASTTVIDIYKRFVSKTASERGYLSASRAFTLAWGIFCVIIALYASKLGNLLEAVNILGSLFYGTILGIFVVAFYVKRAGGRAVLWAAILTEAIVIALWWSDAMAFLWLNLVGCAGVVLFALLFQSFRYRLYNTRRS
ncbi:sodium:solute symporter [Parapedobacter sp. ISTM3]|uniref:Transporter, SSS family n=1 Tax=Parapedobacter luteus TaxID=623280 RepID=A0A1T5DHA8_9SPHI|nr:MULTISPECIES: sodium:solute symporter [Parapedobacter]MBK1442035.1 sodium:solute symporter [Parapedobacter sp. ISTM3]SKB71017.1 transporter, SSS family [Parapedobacter luteus]